MSTSFKHIFHAIITIAPFAVIAIISFKYSSDLDHVMNMLSTKWNMPTNNIPTNNILVNNVHVNVVPENVVPENVVPDFNPTGNGIMYIGLVGLAVLGAVVYNFH